MLHKWTSAVNSGLINGIVFIDLRKAFDLVDHYILLKKRQMYHCSENTTKWFKSYLTDQSQHISFGGYISDKATATAGVPQGSILGQLLFIWFINDMPLHTEGDVDMYGAHTNHVTSSKWADTLICHTTMCRNPVSFLYNPGDMTLWCVEVSPVANAKECSMQEHDWARVMYADDCTLSQ